jgi:hypothetical protein
LAGFFHRLAVFLAGHEVSGPTPIQSAVGGVALISVLAAWVLVNLGAGFSWQELLQALQVRGQTDKNGKHGHVESVTVRANFDAGSIPEVQWMSEQSKIPIPGKSRRPPPPDVPERPSGPQPLPPVSLTGDSPPSSEPSIPQDSLQGPGDGAPERQEYQRAHERHLQALRQRTIQVDAANWLYEKTNGGGADVAVDVLEYLAGPTSSVVKRPYTLTKGKTGQPGEAKIVRSFTGEEIGKGFGEDEAKSATSEVTDWGGGSIAAAIHSMIPGFVGYHSLHHSYGSLQVSRVDQVISKEESETVLAETVRNRFATALTRAVQSDFQAEILDRIKGGLNWLIGS